MCGMQNTEPYAPPRPQGRPRLTHCKHGHERTPENIYTAPSGHRACRLCLKANSAAFAARHQDEWAAEKAARKAARDAARATHCKNGHRLAVEGVYVAPNGDSSCRACRKAASERHELRHMRAVSARLIASLNLGEPTAEELEGDARQRATEERWIAEGRFDDVD